MKNIFEKINFKQPKYMLPAILYIPLLAASYFIFDLFNTGKAEIPDKSLQTTEFLNPDLPDATIKGGDGIGSKYENMAKSWGKIADYTAVDNIEREEPDDDKEKYESQYSQDEVALLGELEQQKALAAEAAEAGTREQEALKELERALAEARLKAQEQVAPIMEDSLEEQTDTPVAVSGTIGFVGLIVPHFVRRFTGNESGRLLSMCAVAGAGFVTLCDMAARLLFAPYELPVGILMSVVGGPVFLYMLIRHKGGHAG